jgi:hypothetical protein
MNQRVRHDIQVSQISEPGKRTTGNRCDFVEVQFSVRIASGSSCLDVTVHRYIHSSQVSWPHECTTSDK